MTGSAFYNEHDPFAAAWLRELISDGLIAPGIVDERSIEDLTPDDLRPFRQVHFFAGIGVWSLAARIAGIPDDAPLWSGSCPCQPFSAAGQGKGFADERHLWPAFHYLIEQCRPDLVVGEQVAGAGGDAWLDAVQADMEATDYAFGAVETVACGFGAPHKRTRNYWVAYAHFAGRQGWAVLPERAAQFAARSGGLADQLADSPHIGHKRAGASRRRGDGPSDGCTDDRLDDPASARHDATIADAEGQAWVEARLRLLGSGRDAGDRRPGPTNGFWRDADWLRCRDEKWRPVEPGTFPLADARAFRNRVGLIRGAGNAVTLGQAAGFLTAICDTIEQQKAAA